MRERDTESQGRLLEAKSLTVDGVTYTLLNDEKLGRVLDLIEGMGTISAEDKRMLALCKQMKLSEDMTIITLYDRIGGGIRYPDPEMGDERKIAMGAFFDFKGRVPRGKVVIDEDAFEDQYVLTRKPQRRGVKNESAADRIKRLEKLEKGQRGASRDDEEEQGDGEGADTPAAPRKIAAVRKPVKKVAAKRAPAKGK